VENTYKHFFSETTSKFITKLSMGSYCGLLYKIVVSIGNAMEHDLAKDPASPKLLGI
jgi:hypothetical protein